MSTAHAKVAAVAPDKAEELWRDYSELAASYGHKADQAMAKQREFLQLAEGFRIQIPAERLAEIDQERLQRARSA